MRLSIKAKIFISLFFVIIIAVIMWLLSSSAIYKSSKITESFSETFVRLSNINSNVAIEAMNDRVSYNVFLLDSNKENHDKAVSSMNLTENSIKELKDLLSQPESRKNLPTLYDLVNSQIPILENYMSVTKKILDSRMAISKEQGELDKLGYQFKLNTDKFAEFITKIMKEANEASVKDRYSDTLYSLSKINELTIIVSNTAVIS